MDEKVFQIYTKPGIKRDGTSFDSEEFSEGSWVRFNRGRPRKVRGYRQLTPQAVGVCRGGFFSSNTGINRIAFGFNKGIQSILQEQIVGGSSIQYYKLPTEFVANDNNTWTFDAIVDATGSNRLDLLAHAAQNLQYIDDDTDTNVFYGEVNNTQTVMKVLKDVTLLAPQVTLSLSVTEAVVQGNPFSLTATATDFLAVFVLPSELPKRSTRFYAATAFYTQATDRTTIQANSGVSFPLTMTSVSQRIETPIKVSGGVVQLNPFTFVYGNNGLIKNNDATSTDISIETWEEGLANEVNVSSSKIVAALPIRGGSASPSGLFWSLDSLVRVSFDGTKFRYDTVSADVSIMSSKAVAEVDGIYYWLGTDRFYIYNGTVQELPNLTNQNYFFDGLNYEQRQKVWALPIKRWGEIWWFYPRDGSTECNDVIVYNYREKIWYDLGKARGCRRSFGLPARIFPFPIMMGNELIEFVDEKGMSNYYTAVWQHESGVNEATGEGEFPIESYIETSDLSWSAGGPSSRSAVADPFSIRITRIEPDFNMNGKMVLTIRGRKYAQDTDIVSREYVFDKTTEKIDMREQRRLLRVRFDCDEVDGDFEMGRVLIHAEPGDIRPSGG